jgi:hypothetical protein
LYPIYFAKGYTYVSIETKTVGVNIFVRIVYNFGGPFVQSVVQVAYGVDNSHVLNEWVEINGLRVLTDYGYGKIYDYSYDIDVTTFYQTTPAKTETVTVTVESDDCPSGTRRNIFNQCAVVFG